MKTEIRWSEPASADFLAIISWIQAENPAAAGRVGRRLLAAVARLTAYPNAGRRGRAIGTRELVVPGLPYLAVYEVTDDEVAPSVVILRVLHGAMDWPPATRDEG